MGFLVHRRSFRSPAVRYALSAAAIIFLCEPFATLSYLLRGTSARAQQTERAGQAREIARGASVVGDLASAETHLFKLSLSEGQYARVVVDKGDFNLSVALLSPDGQTISEYTGRRFGTLRFSFISETPGDAYLRVKSSEQDSATRHYELRLEEVHDATAKDREDAAASSAYAGAETLRGRWEQQSLRAAITKYSEALAAWTSTGNSPAQLRALRGIGECHFILSDYGEALKAYTNAVSLSRNHKDRMAELDTLNDAGYVYVYMGENTRALEHFEQVLSYLAAHPEDQGIEMRRRKAQALNNVGEVYYSLSDLRKALDYFGQALTIWTQVGDRSGEALAHLNLGYTHTDLGDLRPASDDFEHALTLWQAVADSRGEALTLTAIGGLHSFLGDKQSALDYHRRAMRTFQALGNYQGEAAAWNGIAQVYEDLNQPRAALDSYGNALQLYERIGNRDFAALSQYYVGRVYQTLGDSGRALEDYIGSARLSHEVGDRQVEAHALKGIGMVYESYGQRDRALEQYAGALKLYERIGDWRGQARTLNSIGHIHDVAGDKGKALGYYGRALLLTRAVEDRREEVSSLYNLAHAERDQNRLDEALQYISSAVGLIESLRMKVVGEQLRTSYFASVHRHYELYIDLLMRAHQRRPGEGFAAAALQASERARARSLLETLSGQRELEAVPGRNQDLLARARSLWQELDFKLEAQSRLLNGQHNESQVAEGAGEIRVLMTAYQEVLDRIKQESPVYASLTQTQLLQPEGIQGQVGEDTILLEYALGDERSYLWAVTPGSIEGYVLPPRAVIENLTRNVYALLTARQPLAGEQLSEYRQRVQNADADYWPRAAELSHVLLGNVASQIAGKRLLVVGDGALHRIPFDALPEPVPARDGLSRSTVDALARTPLPLVVDHEVVTAPSASVLSALENERRVEARPSRLIAVLADPVFDRYDSRIAAPGDAPSAEEATATEETDLYQAMRDVDEGNADTTLPRLGSSLREAEIIEDLTASGERVISTGFDANVEKVTGGDLGDFRIIHFATHGIFNDERPESSGLVLSRVDQDGKRRNGFLRTEDIYRLRLNADLIVLSACRTGLGRHVNGEGILGITRAFLCAGSRSIIASLWKVNDEATAELMRHFYSAMLKDGLPSSAALRLAKKAMLKQERWRSPYFWAAFVLQGEYRRPPAAVEGNSSKPIVMAAAVPVLALVFLLTWWAVRWRRRSRQP